MKEFSSVTDSADSQHFFIAEKKFSWYTIITATTGKLLQAASGAP